MATATAPLINKSVNQSVSQWVRFVGAISDLVTSSKCKLNIWFAFHSSLISVSLSVDSLSAWLIHSIRMRHVGSSRMLHLPADSILMRPQGCKTSVTISMQHLMTNCCIVILDFALSKLINWTNKKIKWCCVGIYFSNVEKLNRNEII